VFIEKPLSHNSDRLSELAKVVERNAIVSLVGCNMRFHPGPSRVKQLLADSAIGKVLFARLHTGSYLPGWRPGTDYRLNYAAREETGGGCILDCIHEIDLGRWYLGEVASVLCFADHLSSLEIATEDVAILVCRHEPGAMSEVHLDYVQRTYERGCQIVGESGTIFWDFNSHEVRCYQASPGTWTTFPEPAAWNLNQMYLDEMQHFLDCVRERKPTVSPIPDAVTLMDVVFAAKQSARSRCSVAIRKGVTA